MTGAVRMSLAVTGKPASASTLAIEARVREVVLVTRASGTAAAQLVQGRDRPGQRLPRHSQHAIDVDQHRVHALTITAAATPAQGTGSCQQASPESRRRQARHQRSPQLDSMTPDMRQIRTFVPRMAMYKYTEQATIQ